MMTITTDQLSYDGASKLFTAEASELDCDLSLSLELQSHKTGRRVRFTRLNTVRDREHDVLYWEYCPLPSEALPGVRVRIYND